MTPSERVGTVGAGGPEDLGVDGATDDGLIDDLSDGVHDSWDDQDDDGDEGESHRGAFGDFGGESRGALIERTFRERIIIVGVTLSGGDAEQTDADLDELALLVDTAGADVVGRVVQRRVSPDPATYLGKGKVEDLKELSVALD